MSIIEYKFNGETYYTHETWLSSRQRRAWHHIPVQNKNLALYYTLSTLAVVAIVIFSLIIQGHRKIPAVSSFFKQLGLYTGSAVMGVGAWLAWSVALNTKTSSQLTSVVETNDCLYTPFWKSQQSVVNLKDKAYKDNFAYNRYLNRSKGQYSKKQQIQKFNPDLILQNPRAKELLQSAV